MSRRLRCYNEFMLQTASTAYVTHASSVASAAHAAASTAAVAIPEDDDWIYFKFTQTLKSDQDMDIIYDRCTRWSLETLENGVVSVLERKT